MAKITYTHFFNLICRIINFIASLLVLLLVVDCTSPLFKRWVSSDYGEYIAFGLGLILMILAQIYVFAFLDYISAYLYLRLILFTPVSLKEAKELAFLFVPNDTGTWYPLKEIRKLPRHQRKQFLHQFAFRVSLRAYMDTLDKRH